LTPADEGGGKRGEPWYAGGLQFRCTACGACCTGAPGHVWVTPEEIDRMARARGLSRRRFERLFVRRVGKRLSLREREGGDCVMLEGGLCTVYRAKPTRCSTFPFWPETLESPATWRETAERCEGIGVGDRYERKEIERVASGDPEPLLEKQARPALPDGQPTSADVPQVSEATWQAALADLERLYVALDEELPRWRFTCSASGRCCDFDAYGHRLYVTTLEAERFFRLAPPQRANEDPRFCPAWGPDRLCHAREGRMLGCRTYFCGPYPNGVPEDLYEAYYARIKVLHRVHGIPFAYRDIRDWAAERLGDSRGA
jgi:Fe-S-cluster containining protein